MSPGTEPAEMTQIAKRDMKAVTNTKNSIVKAVKNSLSDEAIIEYLIRELPKALDEYASLIFEQAGLDSKIQSNLDFSFLKNLDFQALLTSERLVDTQVKESKLLSVIDEIQRSNRELVTTVKGLKGAPITKSDPNSNTTIQATMTRVEKVSLVLKIAKMVI